MILQGNQRGGARDLALHLLKDENDHVEVHELRGFVADDLAGALNEAYAVSLGTKAKQFLFSLSLNPPPEENVSTADFEAAIGKVEDKLGLINQPRAIVFHEKKGRRHCHAVWSRTDTEKMKAIHLPHTKRKLQEVSRELYIEHGWQMPRGFINSQERDPRNFTLAQWQQAKRIGKDARDIKAALQDCWAISDNQSAFRQALKERGYILANGNRGFVAVGYSCEVFAISKWVGIRAQDVRAKLTDKECLPDVDQAKDQMARDMQARLTTLQNQQNEAIQVRERAIQQKRQQTVEHHKAERQKLKEAQAQRWQDETRERQDRFSKGLRGLLDRITGRRQQIKRENEAQAYEAIRRDQQERDTLIFHHLEQRRQVQGRLERLEDFRQNHSQVLSRDIGQFKEIQQKKRESFDFKQSASPLSERDCSVSDFKSKMRNRDGPNRER